MDEQGLRPRQFAVLLYLLEEDLATVSEIQAHLYISPSHASTVISQLEEVGYVTRTRSSDDNRVVNVQLTTAGKEIAQKTPLGGSALLRRRLDSLPEERLKMLDDVMSDLVRLMEIDEPE